jgi:hypothetical protein
MQDVIGETVCEGDKGGVLELFVVAAQVFCEQKTALKRKSINEEFQTMNDMEDTQLHVAK